MRILLSIAELSTGGAERIVIELAKAFEAEGDAVAVAAGRGAFDYLLEGSGPRRYAIAGRGRSPLRVGRSIVAMRGAAREFEPDLIHSHNVKATGIAAVASRTSPRRLRVPLVATFHGVEQGEYRAAALILRAADAVVCVSEDLLEGLARAGLPRSRMRVIRNAVDLPEPLSDAARGAIDRELDLEGRPVVSLVGRLVEQKAPDRFLESAAKVASEVAGCRFLVVGDGPLRGQLEGLSRRLGLERSVRLLGVRSDARDLIARSDVLVFSSNWEGMSVAALEAMAAAVPVVSTDVQGMPEILGTGAGVLVERSADALAAAVIGLLRDAPRRAALGRAGRDRIASEFLVEAMIAAYRGLYRELVGSGGG